MINTADHVKWLYQRVFANGLLSKYSRYELNVQGNVGVKEIDNLIKQLELYKENIK